MSEAQPRIHHNHVTRDIKPRGLCPACDRAWDEFKDHRHHFELKPRTGWHCRCGESRPLDYRGEEAHATAREVLRGIKERMQAANPAGAEWEALTDPGDKHTAPAWIVDADDLEIRLDATYAADKVAAFIAAAPTDTARLLHALESLLAYGEDRKKAADERGNEADAAVKSYAYHVERLIQEALGGSE